MKKLFALALLTICFATANAQESGERKMGIGAGIGAALVTDSPDAKFAFSVKFSWDQPISNMLYLGTGVGFESWGCSDPFGTNHAFYLTVPAHIGTRFEVMNGKLGIFCDAGPQLAIGIVGTDNYFDFARRFDLGLGLRAGAEIKDMQVWMSLNGGLIPVWKDTKCHNFDFQIGYTYLF